MKKLQLLLLTISLIFVSSNIFAAKDPSNHKNKSSFHPCPVNASAGKRAQVKTTIIRKKGKPSHNKNAKKVTQKTTKTKTVKQKTVKTKTVKQKQEKIKKEKQPKQNTAKQSNIQMKATHKSHSHGKKYKSKSVSYSTF